MSMDDDYMKEDTYWIPGPWPGRLAIVPRPRGGDWLQSDIHAWRKAGIDDVVSLLEQKEALELDLEAEDEQCEACDMNFRSYPVADRGVPKSRDSFATLLHELHATLRKGRTVAVHCRQGIGRSALVAAGLLVSAGISPEDAFQVVERARLQPVPDTDEQRRWLIQLAPSLVAVDSCHPTKSTDRVVRHN
jgi:protein-tyrosine phosphatase